jgi:hypothetical protein
MDNSEIIKWLLQGDVSIQFQTYRDLLLQNRPDLQNRIATEGWGAEFMSKRGTNGHWGLKFYQPKWTSTHYTLLNLKNLAIAPANQQIKETIAMLLDEEKGSDGGINPPGTIKTSDVCLNGMFLNYAAYFGADESKLKSVIDFIILQQLPDGGFNCIFNRSGASHSSLHSTLSVLEGIHEYKQAKYSYRTNELDAIEKQSREFIFLHQLFKSDRTGKIIRQDFLKFTYPAHWYYDVLRALDYFQHSNTSWDKRMQPAMEIILKKRTKNGTWKLQSKHPGQEHFVMEKPGELSRWNTLMALRVLKKYNIY